MSLGSAPVLKGSSSLAAVETGQELIKFVTVTQPGPREGRAALERARQWIDEVRKQISPSFLLSPILSSLLCLFISLSYFLF